MKDLNIYTILKLLFGLITANSLLKHTYIFFTIIDLIANVSLVDDKRLYQ